MRILFADDNREICEMYQLVFRYHAIEANVAHDGNEAIEAVKAENKGFDAIVLDIGMPFMDGWGALEAIRQLPHGKDVPVVVLTSFAFHEQEARAQELGADACLTKPIFPHDLVRVLRDIVQERQQTATAEE